MNLRRSLCLLVILSGHAFAGDAPWRMATTPHYQIFTQASDRDTIDWMRNFDQYILSVSSTLKMDLRALPPLTVVIFARDKDYTPYKLQRPDGGTTNVAGQFVWRPTWSVIAMASDSLDDQSRRIIFHEATHWLMSVDQSSQPPWFSEGIAELFSTFERRGDKVAWGQPMNDHIGSLRSGAEVPLAEFLAEPSAIFDREDHTSRFYAEAWAFTHFLMFSKDPGHRLLLLRFLETFRTHSAEATINTVFGPALPQLEHEFHIYVDQRSWTYMVQPVIPAPDPPALQPAPPALVEASLGLLALGSGRTDLARQHAQKAIDLDASGPGGHAVLAYLALDERKVEQAAVQAEAAIQRGSRDGELFIVLGDSYTFGANGSKPNAARERVSIYEQAINLDPSRSDYDRLTDALIQLDKPREEDAKFLSVALDAFPDADWLRVGSGVVNYRLGHHDVALSALDTAVRPDSKLDAQQRDFAGRLRSGWLIETMKVELEDATRRQDFTAARAVLSRYRERIGKSAQFDSFLQATDDNLAVSELTARFDALRRDNKSTEARAVAQQLLARPNLPADRRRYLEKWLGSKG